MKVHSIARLSQISEYKLLPQTLTTGERGTSYLKGSEIEVSLLIYLHIYIHIFEDSSRGIDLRRCI